MSIISIIKNFDMPKDNQQVKFGMDEADVEKRLINMEIANELNEKDVVIDAFAGIGISTAIWASKAGKVIAIEKDKKNFEMLRNNLKSFNNIEIHNKDNVLILNKLKEENIKLIDLDPFNNFHRQLPYALKLIQNGILLFTSGELFAVMRKVKIKRFKEMNINHFWEFPEKVLFPYIQKQAKKHGKEIRLEHIYIYPTSSRLITTIGKYELSEKTKSFLKKRKKYLGWINQKVRQKSLFDNANS